MKKLPGRLVRKKKIWQLFKEKLSSTDQIKFFNHDLDYTTPWFIDSIVENRSALITYLKEQGIGTRPMYPPINEQVAYKDPGIHPVSQFVGINGLWFPSMIQITDDEIDYIVGKIEYFYWL